MDKRIARKCQKVLATILAVVLCGAAEALALADLTDLPVSIPASGQASGSRFDVENGGSANFYFDTYDVLAFSKPSWVSSVDVELTYPKVVWTSGTNYYRTMYTEKKSFASSLTSPCQLLSSWQGDYGDQSFLYVKASAKANTTETNRSFSITVRRTRRAPDNSPDLEKQSRWTFTQMPGVLATNLTISGPGTLNSTESGQYECRADWNNGTATLVTNGVSWSSSNMYFGKFTAKGLYTPFLSTSNRTETITASFNGLRASKTITIAAMPPDYIPTLPGNPYLRKTTSGRHLEWDATDGANYYRVYRSQNPYADPEPYGGWQTGLSTSVELPDSDSYLWFYFVKAAPLPNDSFAGPFSSPTWFAHPDVADFAWVYFRNAYASCAATNFVIHEPTTMFFPNAVTLKKIGNGTGITVLVDGKDVADSPVFDLGKDATMVCRMATNASVEPRFYGVKPSFYDSSTNTWMCWPHYIYQPGKPCLSLDSARQSVPASGGRKAVIVTATPKANTWWKAVPDQDWVHLYATNFSEGSRTLGYVVDENKETSSRKATITFTQWGATCATLTVEQEGNASASVTYAVDYDRAGGTAGRYAPTNAVRGTPFRVSAPTKSGCTFAGWNVSSGLDPNTARWGKSSNPTTAISESGTKCADGTNDVYFLDLRSTAGGVTLKANWTTNVVAPGAPTDLGATTTLTNGIRVSWTGGSGATSHNVWRGTSTTRSNAKRIKIGASSPYSDNDSALVAGTSYYYWIEATNSADSTFSASYATGQKAAPASITYGIWYALDGGTKGTYAPTNAAYGTAFRVSAPSKSGCTFAGWSVSSGLDSSTAKWGTGANPTTAISGSGSKCANGTNDVYFRDLRSTAGSVTLKANWSTNSVAPGQPNLAFSQPAGWPDAVFMTTKPGSMVEETTFRSNDTVYVSVSYQNNGTADAGAHRVQIGVTDEAFTKQFFVEDHSWSGCPVSDCRWWTNSAFTIRWEPGTYLLYVVLDSTEVLNENDEKDNGGGVRFTVLEEQPKNDDYWDADYIGLDEGGGRYGDNTGATWQDGEPAIHGALRTNSVWWLWDAPATGVARFDTEGSGFDTVMAVFTNRAGSSAISTLALVASDDNGGAGNASQVWFDTKFTKSYWIAVAGKTPGEQGNIALNWQQYVRVSFNGNGATSGAMGAQTNAYEKPTALPPCMFKKDGYNCDGWARSADGEVEYGLEDAPAFEQNTTLYAHWVEAPKPNLAFYRPRTPSPWPAAAFMTTGTNSLEAVETFSPTEPVCLRFAWLNNGEGDAGAYAISAVLKDATGMGISTQMWYSGGLTVAAGCKSLSWKGIPVPECGTYTMEVTLNAGNVLSESNFGDNTTNLTFTVGAPNLTGYKPKAWPAAIFLTRDEGSTNMVDSVRTGETAYLNFCYANFGTVAAKAHHVAAEVQDATGGVVTNWSWAEGRIKTNACRGVTNIAFSVVSEGTYRVVVALDPAGDLAESDETDNALTLPFTAVAPSRPANDAYAAAENLGKTAAGAAAGSNAGATWEPGEPKIYGSAYRTNSVWWVWTAPAKGVACFDTVGSGFDTVLAVFTNATPSDIATLKAVKTDNDSGGNGTSRVWFTTAAKRQYWIAVAGFRAQDFGPIALNWQQYVKVAFKGNGATSGSMGIQTNAYKTATALPACGFERRGWKCDGWATSATGTVAYALDASPAFTKNTTLYAHWVEVRPANDDYAAAENLGKTAAGVVAGSNAGATWEPGEPKIYGSAYRTNSVWWVWTAPAKGVACFDTVGSGFDTVLAVFTNATPSDIATLKAVKTDNDSGGNGTSRVWFTTAAKRQYWIAVAGFRAQDFGPIALNWQQYVKVAFKGNGATSGSMGIQTNAYKTATALPACGFERRGWKCDGWATSATGTVAYALDASPAFTKNTTLYAHWVETAKPNLRGYKPKAWPAAIFLTDTQDSTNVLESVYTGETAYLRFCYGNFGEAAMGTHRVSAVVTNAGGRVIAGGSWTNGELGINGILPGILEVRVEEEGSYAAVVTLDPDGEIEESDESDNVFRLEFTAENPVTLTLGANERSFTADAANSKELAVTANVSWTVKSSASWLVVKTASGSGNGKIVYNVAANTGTTSRTAKITVTGGGITRTFTVTQSGKSSGGGTTAALTLGASERSFTADAANSKELAVTANVSWTVKSSASWLVVKTASGSGNGKIVYNVAANTGTTSRTAKITVTGGGITRTFTVTQSGKSSGGGTTAALTLGASERSFTADAANSKELAVTANVSWTAKSSASWLAVKTASGKGNGKIVYNVAANTGTASRTAKITVAGGGITRTFTVTQSGKAKSAKAKTAKPEVWATTSDGSDGGAVADGDEATGWSPTGAEGAWVALTFEEARDVGAVTVVGERLPEGMRVLVSEDGDQWSEEGGDAVNYLWLLLPGEGEVPVVREVMTEP